MVTKKIRTEYMKRFRDPKWETFSKCYEDSLKYRLTRRVMEHSHKPWFWEGWDSSSGSSGWSTPRPTRNKTAPLSVTRPAAGGKPRTDPPSGERRAEGRGGEADAGPAAVVENGVSEASGGSAPAAPDPGGPPEDTDSGPADSTSSSEGGEPAPVPKRRPRHRDPRPAPPPLPHRDGPGAAGPPAARKTPRAKSQPPVGATENRRPSGRLDWTERHAAVRRTPNDVLTSDACSQTRRVCEPDRRRARSADLEKTRRPQLTVVEDRWVTEYMRCFSARLR
ncbi:centriole, cilia and spindle-associated protein isoform X2 [Pungitius pungitius]|uniref:centriole, cilia and spindle-associated protein isoform X2 n=1 Tax=Pungitius pungitius TaxID=134920 RepID=UPI002E141813